MPFVLVNLKSGIQNDKDHLKRTDRQLQFCESIEYINSYKSY